MDYNKLLICPKCNFSYDTLIHIPKVLPNCHHTLCSKCISQFTSNTIICPIDKIINEKNKINEQLMEDINSKKYNTNNSKILNTELEDISVTKEITPKLEYIKTDTNDLNQNSFFNINSSFSSTFFNLKAKNENNSICSLHLLPNNIICVDDRVKLCTQCIKSNKLHINHQLLTEDDLLKQIENLIDKYQEIEKKNVNFNKNIQEITKKGIMKIIDEKIDKLKESINITKNDIINNINIQIEQIMFYLDFRKNEFKNKYNSLFTEIEILNEDVINWKKVASTKLNKLNEINNISLECFKLIEFDKINNFSNLFQKGILLNDKYNNIEENMDSIIQFCDNGIQINPNSDLIEKIKFKYTKKKNNYTKNNTYDINMPNNNSKYIVNSKLFEIKENDKLIKDLKLIEFRFEYGNKINLNKSIDNKKGNDIKEKGNISTIRQGLNPIITLKQNYNNNIYNNYNSYNYSYQNNITPNINKNISYNLNIKSSSPNNKINIPNKKNVNDEKMHYHKIIPRANKTKNLRDKKNQEKKLTCIVANNSLNKLNKINPSSARNKKVQIKKNETLTNKRHHTIANKSPVHKYNNMKNINENDNSKISKIIKPLDNNSFQDSFNNISGVYYLSSLFDKNSNANNGNDISKTKEKIDTENSLLNFSKNNCNLTNDILKTEKSNTIQINNLIINELKNESPNFNGSNMTGKGISLFCNNLQTKNNIKFKELLMEHCNLNDEDIALLIKALIDKNVYFHLIPRSYICFYYALYLLLKKLIFLNNFQQFCIIDNLMSKDQHDVFFYNNYV